MLRPDNWTTFARSTDQDRQILMDKILGAACMFHHAQVCARAPLTCSDSSATPLRGMPPLNHGEIRVLETLLEGHEVPADGVSIRLARLYVRHLREGRENGRSIPW